MNFPVLPSPSLCYPLPPTTYVSSSRFSVLPVDAVFICVFEGFYRRYGSADLHI